jgi:Cu(I)/Ag(I) efflux system membrane protein CusA/SilA
MRPRELAMVDAAIVMIENAHKHLERAPSGRPRTHIIVNAASEVGPALFFSLLVITVSFLPIFALEAQEGRLFKPLAYTKTFAMAAAALLSVTLVPALMILFVRGRIIPEHKNPVNRVLIWVYRPAIRVALRFRAATILRRAGDRRLLSQHRSGPHAARPLRADGWRPAELDRDGARRRAGDDHG